ncbi:MAG TPA: glutathione S-transferase family protein [Rhizomicrobium sp.]|jgi:glutathione S-transferase|nr:glutathione S-transferase family protein [Rhizomicrobium sp.]
MITVYVGYNYPAFFNGLLRDLRALWALEELGLPYRIYWLDAAKRDHKSEAYRQVHPFGKVPAIRDGQFALFESGAIVNYLFEKSDRIPADAQDRAVLAQWCFAAVDTVQPPMLEIFQWDVLWKDREGRDKRRAELREAAAARLGELDAALGLNRFLLGAELTPADILMVTAIRFARSEGELFAQAPRVRAYMERSEARPQFQRALAAQGAGP